MRNQWLFLINSFMIMYCSWFAHFQQLGEDVVWQVLVAEMAAGPPCSGCFMYLWRKKCLNPLLLRKLGHQDNLPAHTHSAPSSLHLGRVSQWLLPEDADVAAEQ